MLGTIRVHPTPGHVKSKPSLQSISCRDWWLARLLILCNKRCHAIDYLSTGTKAMLEGLKPTEATLVIIMYNWGGEVKLLWFVLNCFWGMPWATMFPQKSTDVDKNLLHSKFPLGQLLECLRREIEESQISKISSKQVFLAIFATCPTLTSSSEDSSESDAFSCCDGRKKKHGKNLIVLGAEEQTGPTLSSQVSTSSTQAMCKCSLKNWILQFQIIYTIRLL